MRTQAPKNRLRDAKHQNQLASRLRALPEDQSLRHVRRLISIDPKIGLSIANRVLHRPGDLEQLLTEGLRVSNESTSRFWIESLGPRLGAVRTVELIQKQALLEPEVAARALYWLPSLVKDDEKARGQLASLQNKLAIREN
jgi:hypothetical protein